MPDETSVEWLFCEATDFEKVRELAAGNDGYRIHRTLDETATDLVSAVRDHGIPFIERHTHLDHLAQALTTHAAREHRARVLPLVLRRLGREDEAAAIVKRELRRVGVKSWPHAEEYRRYAAGFLGSPTASE